jgi:hypothetical protein
MATPLYKRMKSNGTSFYAFPSASEDITLAFQNDDYKMNFTKFVLLNLPKQDLVNNVLDFRESFYSVDPNNPTKYSEQLIESLRNYVANHDVNIRQAKINSNTDFYNVGETKTTIEKIFWKWLRKLNVLDFEPAVHKVDWDKNLSDFNNPYEDTVAHSDYFRKYLWKEREVVNYTIQSFGSDDIDNTQTKLTINEFCKFRTGDKIILSGDTGGQISTGVTNLYTIDSILISTGGTTLVIDVSSTTNYTPPSNLVCYLNYTKKIQYIGEINAMSKVQTPKSNFSEITAFIPHQAGKTPTILWEINEDTNYKPLLEFPLYVYDIQSEILGAENLNSPIRTTPSEYPGSYYGQFDTSDKTYVTSNGDKLRLNGDYYGVKLTNNVGLSSNDYFEKLDDFDGSKIDGLNLDFKTNHYLKMNLPNYVSKNFDEFNAMPIDGNPPADFEFNAILWYYEIDDGQGNITTNLYGIEFLNNPENDNDSSDVENTLITPYKKYVTNGVQDGVSYIFDLNLNYDIDNDMITPDFDPTAVHNMFGFDLYNNVLSTLGKLQENFINICDEFIRINNDLNDIRSLVYSQTDIDYLKGRMLNMEELLKMYQTNQLVNSDTTEIEVDYTGIYPTLKINVVDLEYKDLQNVKSSEIYSFNISNTGSTISNSLVVVVPDYNKKLLNIINDDLNGVDYPLSIVLNNDLKYKQEFDIIIQPNNAFYSKVLNINIQYDNGSGAVETNLITDIDLPIDLSFYDSTTQEMTYNRTHYCNTNITQYVDSVTSTGATNEYTALFTTSNNVFNLNEYVYINNLFFFSGETVVDYTGLYKIQESKQPYIVIDLNTQGLTLAGVPIISFYKGMKIKILRITKPDDTTGIDTSSISDRYLIEKTFI